MFSAQAANTFITFLIAYTIRKPAISPNLIEVAIGPRCSIHKLYVTP
jgi:hypothetical protein